MSADAKQGAYQFKAGSSLPEDRVEGVSAHQVGIVRFQDELYAIPMDNLRALLPELADRYTAGTGTIDLREHVSVTAAFTRAAVPEIFRSVDSNNIVRYDGRYYVVPHQLGEVRWGEEDVGQLPGVAVVSTVREAFAIAAAHASPVCSETKEKEVAAPAKTSLPRLIRSVHGYNIVRYEGWYYGLPQSLGPIDLQKVDVIEIPGVIRDVSADVVEREIQELKH